VLCAPVKNQTGLHTAAIALSDQTRVVAQRNAPAADLDNSAPISCSLTENKYSTGTNELAQQPTTNNPSRKKPTVYNGIPER